MILWVHIPSASVAVIEKLLPPAALLELAAQHPYSDTVQQFPWTFEQRSTETLPLAIAHSKS